MIVVVEHGQVAVERVGFSWGADWTVSCRHGDGCVI